MDELVLYAIKVLKDSMFVQKILLAYAIILIIFLSLSHIWKRVHMK